MREISRLTKITQPSALNHLKALLKENLIIKEKKSIYPTYKANRDCELFKTYKITNTLLKLDQSGILTYLWNTCQPDVIILFGSASRGEDIETSDMDLFVISKEEKLDLNKFEKKLNKEINIFFSEDFDKLSKELKNNIINGIILKGYLKVF
jgi:predicted nucleotidyltransferase